MILLEQPPQPRPREVAVPSPEQRLLLHNVSWTSYETLCDLLEPSGVRMTYTSGNLELMSPSHRHETYSYSLARFVEIMAEEFHLAIKPGQSTTLRRPDLARGIEGDQAFWITHEPEVRTREEIDLTRDPPPDLFIEIEVTQSLLDRLEICAALGIAEVWCSDGESIRVLRLGDDGGYREADESQFFPGIDLSGLLPFLRLNSEKDYLTRIREFREWVRSQIRPAVDRDE